ncbi:glycosyltransferase family 4 protein [Tistrella mobilis]|jgi:glycosyltransferase involved in cell wall biosynthesis
MRTIGLNFTFMPPDAPGGMMTYSWSLLEMLVRTGRYRYVVYLQSGYRLPDELVGQVRVVYVPKFRNRIHRVIWEQTILPVVAAAHGIELMFSPGNAGPVWGPFAKVVTIHDMIYARVPGGFTRTKSAYRRMMDVLTAWTAHRVIVVSETTARDIRLSGLPVGQRMHVVHAASSHRFSPEPAEDAMLVKVPRPYALMVASVLPHKSPRMVTAAARRLWREAGITTVIIGADPEGELARVLAECGSEGVVFLPRVPIETLAAYYRQALCLMMPSEYEGFGLPVIEAQASGCPAVVSRGGALPEVAADAALYIDLDDEQALPAAVLRLQGDPALRSDLVARGYRNARRFSWERAADQTAEIFDLCLAKPRLRGVRRLWGRLQSRE